MKQSSLERTFDTLRLQLAPDLPEPDREYRFNAPQTKHRFDFCWPEFSIAVELEGLYGGKDKNGKRKSRHRTITGFHNDCTKYNLAAAQGWRVFRYTSKHLMEDPYSVFDQLRRAVLGVV